MNKQECKKYFKKAYKKIIEQNKNLNTKNIEFEMKNIAKEQLTEYIAYSKIAVNNMKSSGNLKITLKDLLAQIDILPKIYSKERAIEHVKKKHVNNGKLYRFFDNLDINEVYEYCLNHLDNIIIKDDKIRYLVEMPYDVGYLMNLKTNIIEVIVLSNTDKILTMYPITRVGKYNVEKIKEKNRGSHEK